ncbi:hypothetical protein [Burkholderia sp. Ac-20365]|uniref:hypothetical protein n=1 Tax=Burkholderia sp. Ac-20365 TaxID=2703897 RepID=UPI00197BE339|nr:hypothetical protein [Burkholderia sp. Ac-20365]MBN3761085.1 hypothetical protein [Burkholderia sp. Ac-20365]
MTNTKADDLAFLRDRRRHKATGKLAGFKPRILELLAIGYNAVDIAARLNEEAQLNVSARAIQYFVKAYRGRVDVPPIASLQTSTHSTSEIVDGDASLASGTAPRISATASPSETRRPIPKTATKTTVFDPAIERPHEYHPPNSDRASGTGHLSSQPARTTVNRFQTPEFQASTAEYEANLRKKESNRR